VRGEPQERQKREPVSYPAPQAEQNRPTEALDSMDWDCRHRLELLQQLDSICRDLRWSTVDNGTKQRKGDTVAIAKKNKMPAHVSAALAKNKVNVDDLSTHTHNTLAGLTAQEVKALESVGAKLRARRSPTNALDGIIG